MFHVEHLPEGTGSRPSDGARGSSSPRLHVREARRGMAKALGTQRASACRGTHAPGPEECGGTRGQTTAPRRWTPPTPRAHRPWVPGRAGPPVRTILPGARERPRLSSLERTPSRPPRGSSASCYQPTGSHCHRIRLSMLHGTGRGRRRRCRGPRLSQRTFHVEQVGHVPRGTGEQSSRGRAPPRSLLVPSGPAGLRRTPHTRSPQVMGIGRPCHA